MHYTFDISGPLRLQHKQIHAYCGLIAILVLSLSSFLGSIPLFRGKNIAGVYNYISMNNINYINNYSMDILTLAFLL